jgi:hypothetical protein
LFRPFPKIFRARRPFSNLYSHTDITSPNNHAAAAISRALA